MKLIDHHLLVKTPPPTALLPDEQMGNGAKAQIIGLQ